MAASILDKLVSKKQIDTGVVVVMSKKYGEYWRRWNSYCQLQLKAKHYYYYYYTKEMWSW